MLELADDAPPDHPAVDHVMVVGVAPQAPIVSNPNKCHVILVEATNLNKI